MYTVTQIEITDGGTLTYTEIAKYKDKIKAMERARRVARDASDCRTYGPSSIAYYGSESTVVVAWK